MPHLHYTQISNVTSSRWTNNRYSDTELKWEESENWNNYFFLVDVLCTNYSPFSYNLSLFCLQSSWRHRSHIQSSSGSLFVHPFNIFAAKGNGGNMMLKGTSLVQINCVSLPSITYFSNGYHSTKITFLQWADSIYKKHPKSNVFLAIV